MKRFLSLFCALSIILSASAVPARSLNVLNPKFAKTEKVVKKDLAVKKAAKKTVNLAKPSKAEFAELNSSQSKQLAPAKAKKEATELTVNSFAFEFYEASEDEDANVYYVLYTDEKEFIFDIFTAEGDSDVVLGKTYTLDDMDSYYCYWEAVDSWDYADYTECTFVKTVDAEGFVKINATATDENGDEWVLNYDEAAAPKAPEGGVFVADEISSVFASNLAAIQYALTAPDDKLVFYFTVQLDSVSKDVESGKQYTEEEMLADYSFIKFNNGAQYISIKEATFTKTVAADGSFEIVAEATDENGNAWKVTGSKAAPKISEETLTLNGTAENGSYFSYIQAADADTTVYVALIVYTDDLAGEWTEEDLSAYSYVRFNEAWYVINAANFTVTFDETANQYKVAGKLETENEDDDLDQIIFTIDLTLAGPEPVVFPEELTGDDFELELYGTSQWELSGYSDEDVYLAILGTTKEGGIAGTYGATDLDDYYTYVTMDGETYYDMTDANLVVTFEDNVITVQGTLQFTNEDDETDVLEFTVNVSGKYTIPTERHYTYDEEEAFEETFETYVVDDSYLVRNGILYVDAENENSASVALAFFPQEGQSTLEAGEYPVSNTGEAGTLLASTGVNSMGYLTYSFAGYVSGTSFTNVWFLVAGKAVVDEDGNIEIDALNSNNQAIKCTIKKEAQGIENIVLTEKVQKVVVDGAVYVIRDNKMFNVLGTQVR